MNIVKFTWNSNLKLNIYLYYINILVEHLDFSLV